MWMKNTFPTFRIPRLLGLLLAAWLCMAGLPLRAATTGSWTNGAGNTNTATANGVTVTWSGAIGGTYTQGTLNTVNYWSNPYGASVAGGPSLQMTITGIQRTTRTITVNFSKAVDNPVLHVDRLGGGNGSINNSTVWSLTGAASTGGAITLERLSGNSVFLLSGNSFQRAVGTTDNGNTECSNDPLNSTACGSVRFNGTGITSLTFTVTGAGPLTLSSADGLEFAWSIKGSTLAIAKQTIGLPGSFGFTGTNGVVGTLTLDTTTTNPSQGPSPAYEIPNHAAAITITEGAASGYLLQSASCVDQAGATVASTLAGQVLTIQQAAYRANQDIVCRFVNASRPRLTVSKVVTNDNGGTATATSFGLATSAGTLSFGSPTGTAPTLTYTSNTLTVNAGTYSLTENDVANYVEGSWSCSGSGTTMGGTAFNAGSVTLANGAVATCSITNNDSNAADLAVVKTRTPTGTLTVGQTINYTLVVTNNGPATATGAVITDTPQSGLSCPAGNTVSCSGPGCPAATTTVGTLTAGWTLGTLTSGQSVTLTFSCTAQ